MEQNKHKKNHLAGYILTAVISVMVTVMLMLGLLLAFNVQADSVFKLGHAPTELKKGTESKTEPDQDREIEDFGPIWDQFEEGNSLEAVFAGKTDVDTYMALGRFLDVYDLLKDEYYRELTDEELLQAMLKGLCNYQDSQYTFYLSAEENERVHDSNKGEYSGIGAIVQQKDGIFQISDLVDNSPASQSGLRIGDQFISVDGVEVTSFADVSQLAAEVRGETGTKVELVMYRPADKQEYTFQIKRKNIKNANLRSEYLESGIGYIRIVEFNGGVADNFKAAVKELKKSGAQSYIIDLRNNPGGYVKEVTEILDYILPEGTLATAKGRRGGEEFKEEWNSTKSTGLDQDTKFYVLVNENSASASELMSGALKDWDRAVIIGRQTWGKGVGSVSFDLDDGSGVQVTNFHYYLPKGESIQDVGVTPDIVIEMPEDLQGLSISQLETDQDPDLQKALELARKDLEEK